MLQLRETPLCTGADRAVIQNNLAGAAIQRADMRSVYQAEIFVKFIEMLRERGMSTLDEVNAMGTSSVQKIGRASCRERV